ncbi:MAG: hypothetical protein R3F35_06080 [Myxococcota bacterium]
MVPRCSPPALALLVLVMAGSPAHADSVGGQFLARISLATTGSFALVHGISNLTRTEFDAQLILPTNCTATDLIADFGGTTTARTIGLRVNGSATSLSCSLTSGSPTCSNTTSTVTLVRGDYASLAVSGGTQSGLIGRASFVCVPEPDAASGRLAGFGALLLASRRRGRTPRMPGRAPPARAIPPVSLANDRREVDAC